MLAEICIKMRYFYWKIEKIAQPRPSCLRRLRGLRQLGASPANHLPNREILATPLGEVT